MLMLKNIAGSLAGKTTAKESYKEPARSCVLVPLAVSAIAFSCMGVPKSTSNLPDAGTGTDADSDTDVDADTDTETDNPFEGVPIETCWGRSFAGEGAFADIGYYDGVMDVDAFADGSSVAAVASGKLYVHSAGGDLLTEIDLGATASWVEVKAVEALSNGDIAVLAMFDGATVLGDGTPQEVVLSCDDWPHGLALARYSRNGDLVWARSVCVQANGDDVLTPIVGQGLAELADGSLVVAGALFRGHAIFGAGEPNETELVATPVSDDFGHALFVARYLADGDLDRARVEGNGLFIGREIAALPDGSYALAGKYTQQITLGSGQPNETTFDWSLPEGSLCPPEIYNGYGSKEGFFVAQFSEDGTLAWADAINEALTLFEKGINATTLDDGSVAVAGTFVDTIELSDETVFHGYVKVDGDGSSISGSWAMFLATWNPEGDLEWSAGVSGFDEDSWSVFATGVVGLPGGRVAIAGAMKGAVRFGDGDVSSPTPGLIDNETVFLVTYGSEGDLDGLWRIGEGWDDFWEPSPSLAVAPDGAFLVGGAFEGEPVIDGIGGDTYTLEASSEFFTDGFLIRACP